MANSLLACEQALRSRMGRKESGKRKVGVGEGEKAGRAWDLYSTKHIEDLTTLNTTTMIPYGRVS